MASETSIGLQMNRCPHICARSVFSLWTFFLAVASIKGDTNFVHALNSVWAQHDANAILAFVESSVATNECLETLSAKGIVYGFVLSRGVSATNLLEQARTHAQTSASDLYSEEEKAGIGRCIDFLQQSFVSIAALGGGELSDSTTTNTVYIGELFQTWPTTPPFANYLELFSSLGTQSAPAQN